MLFTDITSDAGISFSGMSEGVCVFDYNNDGFDDILFTTRGGSSIHLYKNNEGINFIGYSNDGPCLKLTLSFRKVRKYSSAYKKICKNHNNKIEQEIILNIYFYN